MVSKKESRKLFKLGRKMARWMRRNGVEHADMFAFAPNENDGPETRGKWYVNVVACNGDKRIVHASKFLTEDEL